MCERRVVVLERVPRVRIFIFASRTEETAETRRFLDKDITSGPAGVRSGDGRGLTLINPRRDLTMPVPRRAAPRVSKTNDDRGN